MASSAGQKKKWKEPPQNSTIRHLRSGLGLRLTLAATVEPHNYSEDPQFGKLKHVIINPKHIWRKSKLAPGNKIRLLAEVHNENHTKKKSLFFEHFIPFWVEKWLKQLQRGCCCFCFFWKWLGVTRLSVESPTSLLFAVICFRGV